jgi:hypothetical protein
MLCAGKGEIMRKIVLIAGAVALSTGLITSVAFASGPVVAGSYTITDLGQGGRGGGPLYADGSIGGGGSFSFGDGQNVGSIQGTTWTNNNDGTATLCFTDTATKGELLFPSPSCFVLPASGAPVVIPSATGGETLVRINLK